jgi:hypothetical protein
MYVSIAAVNDETDAPRSSAASSRALSAADSWLHLLGRAVLTFAIWRGSLFAFDLIGLSLVPNMGPCRGQWQVFGDGQAFWNGFFRWDSGWYLGIVRRGYTYSPDGTSSVAFYPLLPYLTRYLAQVIGSVPVAGLLITNGATIGAIYFLRRLGTLLYGEAVGKLASVLLLVFPTSLFLSAFYTESLFVCLAAGSMYFFCRERYLWCGLLGLAAMLTRSTGVALFAALTLDLLWSWYRGRQRPSLRALALLLIPAGLGAFMLILYLQVGDPLAFSGVMKSWGRVPSWPWANLIHTLRKNDYSFPVDFAKTQRFLDAAFALGFIAAGTVMALTRARIALWAFVLLGILLPLSTYALAGTNRYALGLFPVFIFLAQLCQKRPGLERYLVFVSSLLLGVYSLRFMHCGWVG